MGYTTPFSVEALWNAIPLDDEVVPQHIIETFYTDQEALALEINNRIKSETPFRTGALQASEKYEVNQDPSDPTLIRFYSDQTEQLEQWKRVYVSYQEGDPIGQHTYTNEAHQMYFRNADAGGESASGLVDWAYVRLNSWVGDYVTEFYNIV